MVKCEDCGYLALRNRHTRGLDEAEEAFRQTAEVADVPRTRPYATDPRMAMFDISNTEIPYETIPLCFAMELDFSSVVDTEARIRRMRDSGRRPYERDIIRDILWEEQECSSWRKWQQGFTPKEHREMMDRERMLTWQADREENDRKWRDEQRRSDLEWRAQQASDERTWRQDQQKREDRRTFWSIFWVAIVATAVLAAATIFAAYIQRGGQPTINVSIPIPPTPSISGTGVTPP